MRRKEKVSLQNVQKKGCGSSGCVGSSERPATDEGMGKLCRWCVPIGHDNAHVLESSSKGAPATPFSRCDWRASLRARRQTSRDAVILLVFVCDHKAAAQQRSIPVRAQQRSDHRAERLFGRGIHDGSHATTTLASHKGGGSDRALLQSSGQNLADAGGRSVRRLRAVLPETIPSSRGKSVRRTLAPRAANNRQVQGPMCLSRWRLEVWQLQRQTPLQPLGHGRRCPVAHRSGE